MPFVKTGGLADVAAALPAALAERGVEVTVMLPRYRGVRECGVDMRPCEPPLVPVTIGPYTVKVSLETALVPHRPVPDGGVRVVCLGYDPYFDRPCLYGSQGGYGAGGGDYPDNAQRFSLFSRAVIEAAGALGLSPDIYHVNDWQTALVCAYLKAQGGGNPAKAKSVLTIHNIGYQGMFWKWDLPWTGLGWELFNPEGVEFYDHVNFLKAGIIFADAVTTVSPTYAREIRSSPEFGRGLEGVLRSRAGDLVGIVNGVDGDVWNPATDGFLPARYSARDMSGKAECKAALQAECGLPVAEAAPLIASVGRLTEQKGTGLVLDCVEDVLDSDPDCQFVFLGTGDGDLERRLEGVAARRPGSVRANVGFDEGLAHRIEAGSDVFLMPSRYEPCGLSQLYSMIYGTIPVVRRTGGLADTVVDSLDKGSPEGDESEGTGFVFEESTPEALLKCVRRALARYRRPEAWRALLRRAMKGDWSWDRSAGQYVRLYERLLGASPGRYVGAADVRTYPPGRHVGAADVRTYPPGRHVGAADVRTCPPDRHVGAADVRTYPPGRRPSQDGRKS
jgi:starch synthase